MVIAELMVLTCLGLWFVQGHRALVLAQRQVAEAWADLRAELAARREMVPYLVAAVQANAGQLVEVVANACDMATNVIGVRESAQAEARLTAAMGRLFDMIDSGAGAGAGDAVTPWRRRLAEQEARVAVLAEAYNRRAAMFNTLLTRGAARVFAQLAVFKSAEMYP